MKGFIVGIGSLLFVMLIGIYMYVSYSNQEIELRNLVQAQVDTRDANFDKAWKVIKQQANLTEKYANDFKEIYKEIIAGRYGENGSQAAWSWIQEQNPNIDPSVYTKVQATIESQREQFFYEQKKLISYDMNHKNLRLKFPGSIFVGNRPDVEFNIITSDFTEQASSTGTENDVELF